MSSHRVPFTPIAVIGMAGRFPGASNIDQLWSNLQGGRSSISFFSEEELLASGRTRDEVAAGNFVRAGAVLEDIEDFDAGFFGYNPREAGILDPQQRIFLETAWEALENAGLDPSQSTEAVGVYAGQAGNEHMWFNLVDSRRRSDASAGHLVEASNDKDYLATRVAYKLNLRGPAATVQTACSTSLVAVHLACRSLACGDTDVALAGGVSIQVPQRKGYRYVEGGILSPDGCCRPFDAAAQGTVFGNGCGVVVVKRLNDALADRDHIWAVLIGSAINNDGSDKIGYTAPSVTGQHDVIAKAHASAQVDPETIGYVETHGTATRLGDPVEIAALARAFAGKTSKTGFCRIGSIKSNIGHVNTAAGVAGLIKTILALSNRQIPASLHYRTPNPAIDFDRTPFVVNSQLTDWGASWPRRAAVSAFGIGGTNVHVVVEEAPGPNGSAPRPDRGVITLSAKNEGALQAMQTRLRDFVEQRPELPAARIAYSTNLNRPGFAWRWSCALKGSDDLVQALRTVGDREKRVHVTLRDPHVVFMFPGQGTRHRDMGRNLYCSEPVFADAINCCAALFRKLGVDLLPLLDMQDEADPRYAETHDDTRNAQAALFACEYALSKLWMSLGVAPTAFIGLSVGEFVAAHLAGVFSLEAAIWLVARRGELMQAAPAGAMTAVLSCEEEIRDCISDDVSLAAVNGPNQCVLSGAAGAIEKTEAKLAARGVLCRRLAVSHAFHSVLMADAAREFTKAVAEVRRETPRIPYVSTLTGEWIAPDEAISPEYWGRHLRNTVRFNDAVNTALRDRHCIFLEVGPGQVLQGLLRSALAGRRDYALVSSLAGASDGAGKAAAAPDMLASFWRSGGQVDWARFHGGRHRRVPLPSYPFQREPCPASHAAPVAAVPPRSAPGRTDGRTAAAVEARAPSGAVLATDLSGTIDMRVCALWKDLLGFEQIETDADFLELGGHSLLAMQLAGRVRQAFGVMVSAGEVISSTNTINRMVEHLKRLGAK